jgi:hypothetical protein
MPRPRLFEEPMSRAERQKRVRENQRARLARLQRIEQAARALIKAPCMDTSWLNLQEALDGQEQATARTEEQRV